MEAWGYETGEGSSNGWAVLYIWLNRGTNSGIANYNHIGSFVQIVLRMLLL